jgi:pimeloyl-ACP methyl ester carboxylesterase
MDQRISIYTRTRITGFEQNKMNWDFIYRDETRVLDDATRKTATNGAYINLSEGTTHIDLGGPAKGRPVVLIHGFSVPYFIWDPTFVGLASAGFRVLRYDLFGRGFSDRPVLNYNLNFFVRQLSDLLDGLKFKEVDLIGLSMGGAIASAFTVRSPKRVNRLVLIDPIGVVPMPLSLLYRAAIMPGISELILGLASTKRILRGLASDFFDPTHVRLFQDQYLTQMQIKGFKRAILSTVRNKTVDGFPIVYEELGRLGTIPKLLLWGRNDQTLPLEQSDQLLKLLSNAEFHVIDNSGHIPHYERPEIVNPILINFLK